MMRTLVDRFLQRQARPAGPAADLLLIGHSHAYAVLRGHNAARFPMTLGFFDLLDKEIAGALAASHDGALPQLRAFLAEHPDVPALLSYGGNEHNQLALIEHPVPFDFHHPAGARVDPARWLIPSAAMRDYLAPFVRRLGDLMAGFRKLAPTRAAWVQLPPPPIPDEQHIRDHPEPFREKIATNGISPYGVRHKMWLLQCELMRAHAAAAGLQVLEVPPAALDADGRLIPAAWGVDGVHASPWYGECVLRAFAAAAGRPSLVEKK